MSELTPIEPPAKIAEGAIFLVDTFNNVLYIDETTILWETGVWTSRRLNPDQFSAYTLSKLTLFYRILGAAPVPLSVDYSVDGGETWVETRDFSLPLSLRQVSMRFETRGDDLRFRLRFTGSGGSDLLTIHNYRAELDRRGIL